MLLSNVVVGEDLTNKGASELGPKGRQERSRTYSEMQTWKGQEWDAPEVQEAGRAE